MLDKLKSGWYMYNTNLSPSGKCCAFIVTNFYLFHLVEISFHGSRFLLSLNILLNVSVQTCFQLNQFLNQSLIEVQYGDNPPTGSGIRFHQKLRYLSLASRSCVYTIQTQLDKSSLYIFSTIATVWQTRQAPAGRPKFTVSEGGISFRRPFLYLWAHNRSTSEVVEILQLLCTCSRL